MAGFNWQQLATLIGALSALVGVPLTAIVLYLRAIREGQRTVQAMMARRLDTIEVGWHRLERSVERIERNYTTKEEWVRETMLARDQLGRLAELMARVQAELESTRGLATQFVRTTHAIVAMTERLGQRLACGADPKKERPDPRIP